MNRAHGKRQAMRALLQGDALEFLLEAHSGVSARIAEEAGFRGIWASGLAISAQCGVRDSNELSWTQVLEIVELMADATEIPILVDGDGGHGDFNNVRRLVRKLEQRGAAGICIEDKVFPKTNSFIHGARQALVSTEEFCGKLRAARDSALDASFCIVARTEALIAGFGLDAALARAEAYRQAGADAVLVHSARSDADEILAFAREWAGRLPLAIVPTTYARTPTEVFRRAGVRLVIWANPLLRASVAAMQSAARRLRASASLADLEPQIAPLREIFRLQDADELLAAERRYRGGSTRPGAILLSRGGRAHAAPLSGLTDALKRDGVHDIAWIDRTPGATGELAALAHGLDRLGDDALLLYSRLAFRRYILQELLESDAPLCVLVDSAAGGGRRSTRAEDFAYCSAPDDAGVDRPVVLLDRVERTASWRGSTVCGRWIGMLRVRGEGCAWLQSALRDLERRADFPNLRLPELLNALIEAGHPIRVSYVHGHWRDLDARDDRPQARMSVRNQGAALLGGS